MGIDRLAWGMRIGRAQENSRRVEAMLGLCAHSEDGCCATTQPGSGQKGVCDYTSEGETIKSWTPGGDEQLFRCMGTMGLMPSMANVHVHMSWTSSALCLRQHLRLPSTMCKESYQALQPPERKLTWAASIVVSAPPEAVWAIITDYANLATHVPNLVTSELRPHPLPGGIRLFQEGAQKIVGVFFFAIAPDWTAWVLSSG
eukprot:scaffold88281_cov32-Tisochrysis_lutea.AAC.2